jgi:CTP:molybdopterin cytidylyltransferase MocA
LSGDTGGKALLESIRPAPKSLALGDVAADIDYPEDLTAFIQQIEVE